MIEIRRRFEYPAQPQTRLFNHHQALVSPQRCNDCNKQLAAGQFRFGFVIIDVIFEDDFFLGGLPRLTGTQDNADQRIAEFIANAARQTEASIVSFHYHIEKHQRGLWMSLENFKALRRRIGRKNLQRPTSITNAA